MRNSKCIVAWLPHEGLPSYPEIRWAVQTKMSQGFSSPRRINSSKPKFDTSAHSGLPSIEIGGFDLDAGKLMDVLEDVPLQNLFDGGDRNKRIINLRGHLKEQGYEAIAWYQPYHIWTEETWGIYFDGAMLDDLALSFLEDFKTEKVAWSYSLAAFLAFGLIYAHELFHAKVEAALSWQELNAQQPKFLRYQKHVYQALRETPESLEEALANWSAWSWFKTAAVNELAATRANNSEGLERIVEAALSFSPPGYREWRLGKKMLTWRIFCNQLATGKPGIATTGKILPLESLLTGSLPYDFQSTDIPIRFVGSGIIADRLQTHPATFNEASRREIEKALKYFRHAHDPEGGKGGHQKWTGPDQRAFILPTRDPVSRPVFNSFLHHVGIDKATYVRQVRPNL